MTESSNILVLDLGSTHLKASIISPNLDILFEKHKDNLRIPTAYYEALDVDDIEKFIFDAIEQTVDDYDVGEIIVSTHGSSIALVDDGDDIFSPFMDYLALPVMFYGQDIPLNIQEEYKDQAPDFSETFSDVNPLALTGALQLFWQSEAWPKEFSRTKKIMMWPSYWSFRLSGVACNDFSSLGAQNQIWNPVLNDFSSVIKKQGWDKLFAPVKASSQKIGVLHSEIQKKYNLKNKPNILCGVHDSNANYWRFVKMGFENATIISTGTWIISFNPNLDPKKLEGKADCCTNTNVIGKPISCSRYQGGLELSILLKKMGNIAIDTKVNIQDLQKVLQSDCMVLPSFASSGGPVPHKEAQGKIEGDLADSDAQKYALAILYSVMMTQIALNYIEASEKIIIDGPFTKNSLFLQLMALLNPYSDIYTSTESNGTLFGTALLSNIASQSSQQGLKKIDASPDYLALKSELNEYMRIWYEKIKVI